VKDDAKGEALAMSATPRARMIYVSLRASRGVQARIIDMLASAAPMGFLAVSDFARARAFYEGVLGLQFVSQDDFALVMRSGPVLIRFAVPPEVVVAPYTVFGWQVADIDATVALLSAKGVSFERYAHFSGSQRADGVWSAPSGAKVAWFKDPDGNPLSLSRDVA
jgi:catechol 2,3-dioxygenase-like lactoylglutathione lyase family enzyme